MRTGIAGCRLGQKMSSNRMSDPSQDDQRDTRLATYGTLAPGRINHSQLADLEGTWVEGWVIGHLQNAGWGATHGYPGLVLAPDGDKVALHLFESADLPDHWEQLDAFEGTGYRRTAIEVHTYTGPKAAWIYALAEEVPANLT